MPTARIASFNIADLPWPFEKPELQAIPGRLDQIRNGLAAYDYRLVQEDWFQRMDGTSCGDWYWFPSGLTLGAPAAHPLVDPGCERHEKAGFASGDWLARKGWQWADSQGVRFANLHLDAGDADWSVRQEQIQAIRDALPDGGHLVVGGDFNTENQGERDWTDAKLGEVGLVRASVDTTKGKDHVYVRGPSVTAQGTDPVLSELSDHPAVWVALHWP